MRKFVLIFGIFFHLISLSLQAHSFENDFLMFFTNLLGKTPLDLETAKNAYLRNLQELTENSQFETTLTEGHFSSTLIELNSWKKNHLLQNPKNLSAPAQAILELALIRALALKALDFYWENPNDRSDAVMGFWILFDEAIASKIQEAVKKWTSDIHAVNISSHQEIFERDFSQLKFILGTLGNINIRNREFNYRLWQEIEGYLNFSLGNFVKQSVMRLLNPRKATYLRASRTSLSNFQNCLAPMAFLGGSSF